MDKHKQHAELRKRSRELREIIQTMNSARRQFMAKNKAAHAALLQTRDTDKANRIMALEHEAFREFEATVMKYKVANKKYLQALDARLAVRDLQYKGARR